MGSRVALLATLLVAGACGESNSTAPHESAAGAPSTGPDTPPDHWGEPLVCDDLGYDTSGFEFPFESYGEHFQSVTLREDGSFLGMAFERAWILSPGGALSPISVEPLVDALGPDWDGFLHGLGRGTALMAMRGPRGAILDIATGTVATFDAPAGKQFGSYSWSISNDLILDTVGVPKATSSGAGTLGADVFDEELIEVRGLSGAVVASSAPLSSRYEVPAGDDELVWKLEQELVSYAFDGQELYRYDFGDEILTWRSATASRRLLVMAGPTLRWLDADAGELGPKLELPSMEIGFSLSPDGTHGVISPAATDSEVQRLVNGRMTSQQGVDVGCCRSYELNDEGTLIIAGFDLKGSHGVVEAVAVDGTVLWRCAPPGTVNASVVELSPDGHTAVVLFDDRLRLFAVPSP